MSKADTPLILPLPLAIFIVLLGAAGLWATYAGWKQRELGFLEMAGLGIAAALLIWGGIDSLIGLYA